MVQRSCLVTTSLSLAFDRLAFNATNLDFRDFEKNVQSAVMRAGVAFGDFFWGEIEVGGKSYSELMIMVEGKNESHIGRVQEVLGGARRQLRQADVDYVLIYKPERRLGVEDKSGASGRQRR